MNAENDIGEFSGDLEREDKAFIFDLVVRECFRDWDSLDKSQYECAQQCVICRGKNAHELESIASIDLLDGLSLTFPFEKRKMLISQLVHEFFENKWKAKQIESKMQRMMSFKGSLLERSKNTSLKRPRNKTENNVPRDKIIDIDMENEHCFNKKPKLLKNTFLENLDRLVHLNQKYNSYFADKTEEEIDFLKGIPENLLRRANDQDKYNRNECVKSTNGRYSASQRKPKPHYYTRDDRSSSNKYPTDHRKPKPKYYSRGDSSLNNKSPAGNPKTAYVNKVVSSHNFCIEKKFQFRPHDGLKPEYTHCFDMKVERPPDKAESVVCLPLNDTPAAFAIDRQKGKISLIVGPYSRSLISSAMISSSFQLHHSFF